MFAFSEEAIVSWGQLKPVIIVHGGAGTWYAEREKLGLKGVKEAAKKGFEALTHGESAVECVAEAVAVMEDEGIFNAGYGSSFNIEKKIEMEASIMEGKTLNAGARARALLGF
ncbi:MAG: isoaspartyl peptidase/L-asparaginase [Candidatus Bathyarchaeota archaeon]